MIGGLDVDRMAHNHRRSWFVFDGWAPPSCALAYSRPGRHTSTSTIRRQEEIVRQISARLSFPVKVDEITRAVDVRGKGDEITYDYSIAAPLTDLGGRQQVQGKLEQQWLTAACKTKDFQTLLRGGYTVQMRYSFQGSAEEILVSIPPRACGY